MKDSLLCRGFRRGRSYRMMVSVLRGLFGAGVLVVTTAGVAAAAQPGSELVFLSPEQYQARWGKPAPAAADVVAEAGSGSVTVVRSPMRRQQGDGWAIIKWDERDLRGVSAPVREGNNFLGYAHYASEHNLTSRVPIHAAFQTHRPDKEFGARVEYTSLAVDNRGGVRLTVRVIVQAAGATDDRAHKVTDGKNIGVITAYCEGTNVCPGWVNTIR
ncbi:hypothetical protein [Nocardia sp. NPDC057455]|uniref:hypothetical protein n=1 Tax=Nocardia sp. NPDC057455 TaxID=3346138 RepID=UPI0036708BA8